MMKRFVMIAAILGLSICMASQHAYAEAGKTSITLDAGMRSLIGGGVKSAGSNARADAQDVLDQTQFAFGLRIGYDLNHFLRLELGYLFSRHQYDDALKGIFELTLPTSALEAELDYHQIEFGPNWMYDLGQFIPYAITHIGFVVPNYTHIETQIAPPAAPADFSDILDVSVSAVLGAGLDFYLTSDLFISAVAKANIPFRGEIPAGITVTGGVGYSF